ncbi:MAG: Lacal_2735 family protein [Flavobacteriaceae bacterium]|nr:Lacal_2735 family protein [Flavobacteriaceae bacterium]
MDTKIKIKNYKNKLLIQYKQLIEEAYNLRQTDHALSDISEYRAMIMLNKLNRLKYLDRDLKPLS